MPVEDIFSLIMENGAVAGLAFFAIWMLNRVWQARIDETHQMWEQTKDALIENTRVLAKLCAKLDEDNRG